MTSATAAIATSDEGRNNPRTHVFVAATLYGNGSSRPVNIRNISSSGALIESSDLPPGATSVVLRRGSLQATGQIAWSSGRQAGITFTVSVHVSEWIARQPPAHQARVDSIVSEFKTSAPPDAGRTVPGRLSERSSITNELITLQNDLTELESKLIADIVLVATHPEIQLLDISLQRIKRLLSHFR